MKLYLIADERIGGFIAASYLFLMHMSWSLRGAFCFPICNYRFTGIMIPQESNDFEYIFLISKVNWVGMILNIITEYFLKHVWLATSSRI